MADVEGAPEGARAGKKRKVAVIFGYVGAGYAGMQRNPGVRAVEDEVEEAFHAAGGISDDNLGHLRKVSWSRAARTDKGVSAVGQVVALKMVLGPPGLLERINAALPAHVRAFSLTRVTSGFSAKNLCDRRRYRYLLPAWTLQAGLRRAPADGTPPAEEPQRLEALNQLLACYVGSHRFHNFTTARTVSAGDPQAVRFVASFRAGQPLLLPAGAGPALRFVPLEVVGQSFMLHQIRKMVGCALGELRGVLAPGHLPRALASAVRCEAPLAPDLGLYLAECIFGAYNARWEGTHEALGLAAGGEAAAAAAAFERDAVMAHIAGTEARDGVFSAWVSQLHAGGAAAEEAEEAAPPSSDEEEAEAEEAVEAPRPRPRPAAAAAAAPPPPRPAAAAAAAVGSASGAVQWKKRSAAAAELPAEKAAP